MTGATVNTAAFFASLAKLVAAVTDKVLNETKPHIPSTDLAAPEIDLIVNSRATDAPSYMIDQIWASTAEWTSDPRPADPDHPRPGNAR